MPTDFRATDDIVAVAAAHHLSVLPDVSFTPPWARLRPNNGASPPRSDATYGRFMTALIDRYGPSGSFWRANPSLPKVPIRMWQIWNEPNFNYYWSIQPWQPSYVKLLKAAHDAIKKADRHAEVILAGLTNYSWEYLTGVYKIRGARSLFDAVSAHPYTATPAQLVTVLSYVRKVMNRYGDKHKPLFATEVGFPSAKGKAKATFEAATNEAGQAKLSAQAVKLLAADRGKLGLQAFYYYEWIGNETMPAAAVDQFNFSGLEKFLDNVGVEAKPALAAFASAARAIER